MWSSAAAHTATGLAPSVTVTVTSSSVLLAPVTDTAVRRVPATGCVQVGAARGIVGAEHREHPPHHQPGTHSADQHRLSIEDVPAGVDALCHQCFPLVVGEQVRDRAQQHVGGAARVEQLVVAGRADPGRGHRMVVPDHGDHGTDQRVRHPGRARDHAGGTAGRQRVRQQRRDAEQASASGHARPVAWSSSPVREASDGSLTRAPPSACATYSGMLSQHAPRGREPGSPASTTACPASTVDREAARCGVGTPRGTPGRARPARPLPAGRTRR